MALGQSPVRMAFDASAVSGARSARGLRGRRLASFARVPLGEGAIVPSPHERNVVRPDEVRDAAAHVARSLGAEGEEVALLLPDGVARIVLLEAPSDVRPEDYARFRLAANLPYPARDAVVQAEAAGAGRILAAVAWRPVLAEYEAAAQAAGVLQGRLDLAPLAGLHALRRAAPRNGRAVDVVLGDVAYALALHDGGALRLLRNRRRDRDVDEPRRLVLEIERAVRMAGLDARPRARVVGPGASSLLRELGASGGAAEPGWSIDGSGLPVEASEVPWLGSLFA